MNTSGTSPPGRSSFPREPEEFEADPRISFSKISNKFILEAEDGQEYEFDDALKRWVPVVRPHPPAAAEGPPFSVYLYKHMETLPFICSSERFLIAYLV